MARAWVALGSNLGGRAAQLASAVAALRGTPGIERVVAGDVEETAPLGGVDQPAYLNQMLVVDTVLDPPALLARCQEIERAAGRERRERWGSRTIDLDVVRWDGFLCDLPTLTLPHAGLRDRNFWAREIVALEVHD